QITVHVLQNVEYPGGFHEAMSALDDSGARDDSRFVGQFQLAQYAFAVHRSRNRTRRSGGDLRPPDQPLVEPTFGGYLGRNYRPPRQRDRQARRPHSPGVDHAGRHGADDTPQLEPRPRIDLAKLAQVVDGNIAAQLWQLAPRPAHDRDMTGPARRGQRT